MLRILHTLAWQLCVLAVWVAAQNDDNAINTVCDMRNSDSSTDVCSTPANSLLQSFAKSRRKTMMLGDQIKKHRAWRTKHNQISHEVNKSQNALDDFIEGQKESSDHCSARLMEAKRSLDGFLKDLKAISQEASGHVMILETETENLKIAHMSIDSAETMYNKEVAQCDKEHKEASEEVDRFKTELEELNQMAKPEIRYEHVIEDRDSSFFQTSTFSKGKCLSFLKYEQRHQNRRHHKDIAALASNGTKVDPRKCKGKDALYQKRYRAWCDQAVGYYMLDGEKVRSSWCVASPTGKVKRRCKTKKDFGYCFMAFYGCTANKRDAQRCCTGSVSTTVTSTTTNANTVISTTAEITAATETETAKLEKELRKVKEGIEEPPLEGPPLEGPALEEKEPLDKVQVEESTTTKTPSTPETNNVPDVVEPSESGSSSERSCDTHRKELQEAFTDAYKEVRDLLEAAHDRVEDIKDCYATAKAKKSGEEVPLVSQRESASVLIQHSSYSIAALEPVIHLASDRAERLQKHITETLTPECKETDEVSELLQKVRDLIISLERCPGRNDFRLQIPIEEDEDDENNLMEEEDHDENAKNENRNEAAMLAENHAQHSQYSKARGHYLHRHK